MLDDTYIFAIALAAVSRLGCLDGALGMSFLRGAGATTNGPFCVSAAGVDGFLCPFHGSGFGVWSVGKNENGRCFDPQVFLRALLYSILFHRSTLSASDTQV